MKYLVSIILIGAGVYLFYRIRCDNSLPDIADVDCVYETHGWEACACWDCIERRTEEEFKLKIIGTKTKEGKNGTQS